MKTLKLPMIAFLMSILLVSCEDDNSPTGVLNPEKFTAVITGDVNTEITYDEDKFVAVAGGNQDFEEEASTYLAITAGNSDASMVINLYPPADHPRSNDVLSISIKTNASKPWTKDKEYTTAYINQLQNFEEYAIVSYWSDEDRRDYVSFYRFESSNGKVKLWREGRLLKGSIRVLKLATFNGSRNVTIERLDFEMRPEDDDLID
ncbi:hypothetical protein [Lunatibacter salilacus]|uniref:hypothetical protein n=1 Tax=Lunatibacter salilacus TaxID=2483804 RepID=UPI00131E44C6|nr:hypothetical protein [Lunatibacter salilacus]